MLEPKKQTKILTNLKNTLLLIILTFYVQCLAQEAFAAPLIKTIYYQDYKIELFDKSSIEFGETIAANELIISKNGNSVFHINQGVTNVDSGYDLKNIEKLDSITSPILVITETSGGMHCCWTTTILNLEDNLKILAKFDGGSAPAELLLAPEENGFIVTIFDGVYEYKFTSLADSPQPKIILSLQNGKYLFDQARMQRTFLDDTQLISIVDGINSKKYLNFKYEFGYKNDALYFRPLLNVVLDLIYSGRAEQAWLIIDRTWPGDKNSKNKFITDLTDCIGKSKYAEALNQMNNTDIKFPALQTKQS